VGNELRRWQDIDLDAGVGHLADFGCPSLLDLNCGSPAVSDVWNDHSNSQRRASGIRPNTAAAAPEGTKKFGNRS
jgi:hypothetical protein